ncbi:MAG: glutathione S-transferase [Pseudomonadota bacterium]
MELIHSPASPYVRMAVVTAYEVGLIEQVRLVDVGTSPFNTAPEVAAANPLGKIPALIRPDGGTIYDSRVICRYLNDRAGGNLYPEGATYDALTLEALGQGIADCTVSMSYEMRLRPDGERSEAWVEAQWAKNSRALDALESRWMAHLYGPLDIGHIAVGCALGYIDLRHDVRKWRESRPSLAAWFEKFAARASMQATAPEA